MDYIVMEYGLEEYGVEWGYEIDEDGNRVLCVSDDSTRDYVSSEEEAQRICEELIARWQSDQQ